MRKTKEYVNVLLRQYKIMEDYKKILEGVVNIINTTERSDIGFDNICTYIGENCPELRESEDEKIRKDLIGWIEDFPDMIWRGHYKKDVIAWLEKQGGQKPKFKVGDWLINDHCLGEVILLTDDAYMLDNGQSIPFSCKTTRLWDIAKDAKEGDVLASKYGGVILIFARLDSSTSFSSYYNTGGNRNCGWLNKFFIPATKEQRYVLIKAMADAGYKWNQEKLKIEKIKND